MWSLPVPFAEKQPYTMMFPPPNFTVGMVFLGWCAVPFLLQTWCVLWHPNSYILLSCDHTIFSQYFTGFFKCCAANFEQASTYFFFQQWSLAWWACIQAMAVECITVFFETTVPTNCKSFWSSPQVVLGSWTTLLIILFTPLSEILRGAPDRGKFIVKWLSFHFRIMAPTLLTGTFRRLEMRL